MRSPKPKPPPSLQRRIHFYRSSVGKDAAGDNIPFAAEDPLSAISRLGFTDSGGRYLLDPDGNALCTWIDGLSPYPRIRFSQVRRVGLPQIDAAGKLSDLDLGASEGLVEPVHMVFFSDGLVGAEFNFYGPRPSRLGYYVKQIAGLEVVPVFNPLLRSDVAGQLERLGDIRLFELKGHFSYAKILRQADADLGAAFDAAAKLGAPEEIAIVLKSQKPRAPALLGRLKASARKLVGRSDLRTEASKFLVKGLMKDSGRVEALDLLRDQLIAQKRIVRMNERSRALAREAAYAAIVEAFEELSGELAQAAAIAA